MLKWGDRAGRSSYTPQFYKESQYIKNIYQLTPLPKTFHF